MNDLISRQAAIDALRDAENHAFNGYYKGLVKAHKIIADLPSEQKRGKWLVRDVEDYKGKPTGKKYIMCDQCGQAVKHDFVRGLPNYCEGCGADMGGETDG